LLAIVGFGLLLAGFIIHIVFLNSSSEKTKRKSIVLLKTGGVCFFILLIGILLVKMKIFG